MLVAERGVTQGRTLATEGRVTRGGRDAPGFRSIFTVREGNIQTRTGGGRRQAANAGRLVVTAMIGVLDGEVVGIRQWERKESRLGRYDRDRERGGGSSRRACPRENFRSKQHALILWCSNF